MTADEEMLYGYIQESAREGISTKQLKLKSNTVRTGIIGPDSRTLELPLLVWSGSFFFFFCLKLRLRRSLFAVRSPPYPREGISNVLARGPIIPVSTSTVTYAHVRCSGIPVSGPAQPTGWQGQPRRKHHDLIKRDRLNLIIRMTGQIRRAEFGS